MFRKLSESIAGLLITNNIVSDENREAYIYGLELLFPQILFYLGIMVIAIFTKTILLSLLFVTTYKVLRQYTGGYHCKSAEMCLAVSILIYLTLLLFYFNFEIIDTVLIVVSVIASGILLRFSPIEDKNKPLDNIEKKKYHKLSIVITVIAVFSVLISFFLNLKPIFYALAWSISADAVLILLTLRRCKNEENNIEGSSSNG